MTPNTLGTSQNFTETLIAFNEIKTLYSYDQGNDLILFNNKDILVDGKPIFLKEWFNKGIYTIQELLNVNGQYFIAKQIFSSFIKS